MRISDWSSDVCSSDLPPHMCYERFRGAHRPGHHIFRWRAPQYGSPGLPQRKIRVALRSISAREDGSCHYRSWMQPLGDCARERKPLPFGCVLRMARIRSPDAFTRDIRSEEHTSELQSLMRISYAVFCLKKKKEE